MRILTIGMYYQSCLRLALPEATSDELKNLRGETRALKETGAELLMENRS